MPLSNEQLKTLYANMVRARRFDEKIVQGIADGKTVSFFHSGLGEEAVGVGGCAFLRPDDFVWYHHRGHGIGHIIAKGGSPREFVAEHFGKATGACNGVAGFHFVDPEHGMLGFSGTIGSAFPVTLGWGVAAKMNNRGQAVVCFFGDGASNRGTLHEAMNMASVMKLPIAWVCENNLYAQFMPLRDAFASEDIANLAIPYGMPSQTVDGQDVVAVHEAVQWAVERARAGEGPSLVECKTYRFRAHSEGAPDVAHFELRPPEEVEEWKRRDPILLFRERLLGEEVATASELDGIDAEAAAEADEAERFAMESPPPDASILSELLYAR
ncbi:MAG: thiamine pyrophosphate-dependent dehydrogenase E1 component subunit alpha [Thermoflexaceae bacterium]|nr:thiamine pyrophosphate-dependent dehydrogenase E1 component subunit alpha [Thermoflexaceae bacterium]